MANTPIEGGNTSPQVLSQGPVSKYLSQLTPEQMALLQQQGEAMFNGVRYNPIYGGGEDNALQGYASIDTSTNPYGVSQDYGVNGQFTGTHTGDAPSWFNKAMPGLILGAGVAGLGIPGIVGNALNTSLGLGLGTVGTAALGGAAVGGLTSAATGGNPLLGAVLGGAGGYAQGSGLFGSNGYNYNGPAATSQTIGDLTGSNTLTGLDQYTVGGPTASDLMGGGAGGAGSGGYDPLTNSNDDFLKSIGIRPETTDPFLNSGSPTNNDLAWNSGYFDSATGGEAPYSNEGNNYPTTGSTQGPGGSPINASLTGSNLGVAALGGAGGGLLSGLTTGNKLVDAALISGGAGLLGNKVTGDAISNSINNTTAAAQQAGSTLKDIYNQQLGFVQPYQQLGQQGVNAISANMPYLQHQFNAQDLQAGLAPNYDFMLQQGQMGNQRAANMGGGAIGGNALQGLNKFTQDYAGNAYQNAFNNYQTQRNNIYNSLSGIAGMGQTANQQAIGAGTGYGQQQTALTTGLAAAQAGANVGQAQNTSNLISNLGNNLTLASLLGQKQAVA